MIAIIVVFAYKHSRVRRTLVDVHVRTTTSMRCYSWTEGGSSMRRRRKERESSSTVDQKTKGSHSSEDTMARESEEASVEHHNG